MDGCRGWRLFDLSIYRRGGWGVGGGGAGVACMHGYGSSCGMGVWAVGMGTGMVRSEMEVQGMEVSR